MRTAASTSPLRRQWILPRAPQVRVGPWAGPAAARDSGAKAPRRNPPPLRTVSSSLWPPQTASCLKCVRRSGEIPAAAAANKKVPKSPSGIRTGFFYGIGAASRQFPVHGGRVRLAHMFADGQNLHTQCALAKAQFQHVASLDVITGLDAPACLLYTSVPDRRIAGFSLLQKSAELLLGAV